MHSRLNFPFLLSGQEKSFNLAELCQNLWFWLGLSSQTQQPPALMACTGGHLVLHMPWGKSEGHNSLFLSVGINSLGNVSTALLFTGIWLKLHLSLCSGMYGPRDCIDLWIPRTPETGGHVVPELCHIRLCFPLRADSLG